MEFHLTENRTVTWLAVLAFGVLLALAGGAVIAFGSPAIAFAIALGIVAGAVVLSSIEFGLYAMIAIAVLLPFGALPLNIGFNPTFLDLALLAVFGVWLVRIATRQDGEFVATPLALPMVAFMVLAVFSFIAGLGHAPLTSQVLRQFAEVLIAIALFFVVVNVVQTRDALKRIVIALIVAGFVSAAIGIVLYFCRATRPSISSRSCASSNIRRAITCCASSKTIRATRCARSQPRLTQTCLADC